MRHYFIVFVAKYLEKSVQSWARIIIPLVKDAAEWNRVEILRGVNVESMTRGDP
jgi:REP element-mobilizing transposase RayT